MSRTVRWVSITMILIVTAGCEPSDPPRSEPATEASPAETTTTRPWRTANESSIVVLAADDPDLLAATAESQRTLDDARGRWSSTPADERVDWAVKWAAATATGEIEFVWVTPLRWSAFRIEGQLASPPQQELLCGKSLHEVVSFPVEDVVDWVHFTTDTEPREREGGFTIDVLEDRFGTP